MRRTLLVAPLLVALAVTSCAKASGTAAAAAPAPAIVPGHVTPTGVTPTLIALGDSLFNTGACQRCHGQKGIGANNGPSLVEGPWLHHTGKYEEIVATITNGIAKTEFKTANRPFAMNARGGRMALTDDQIQAVAAYVWSISRNRK